MRNFRSPGAAWRVPVDVHGSTVLPRSHFPTWSRRLPAGVGLDLSLIKYLSLDTSRRRRAVVSGDQYGLYR